MLTYQVNGNNKHQQQHYATEPWRSEWKITSVNHFICLIQCCFNIRFLRKAIQSDMYGSASVEYNLERNNAPFSQRSSSEALRCLEPSSSLLCRRDVTIRYSIVTGNTWMIHQGLMWTEINRLPLVLHGFHLIYSKCATMKVYSNCPCLGMTMFLYVMIWLWCNLLVTKITDWRDNSDTLSYICILSRLYGNDILLAALIPLLSLTGCYRVLNVPVLCQVGQLHLPILAAQLHQEHQ